MAINRSSNQAWVMSQIGWDSKTKASLWGIYCNEVLDCARPGLLQDLLMGLMNCMVGDNDKELPTFRADAHLGPLNSLKDFRTLHSQDTFLVTSQDVYSKAEREEEAAMWLILWKVWSVNGLCEYSKKSLLHSFYPLAPQTKKIINKTLTQYFKITIYTS